MPDAVRPIRRALLSVSDKAGIVELARTLAARGAEIVSTGGTARALRDAGLTIREVADLTGLPEMFSGRVKTLHPAVHGGILAVQEDAEHQAAMDAHGIGPIDLVCVNLYPFEQTVSKPGVSRAEAIEQIDIGGPAMIRSAAKNHDRVAVLTSPEQYGLVAQEVEAHGGTTRTLRESLATAAFARTSAYDAAIAAHLGGDDDFPPVLAPRFERMAELRYGENPHQRAAVYRDPSHTGPTVVGVEPLHGKPLSYNNVADASAALELVRSMAHASGRVAAAVVKHANPCGAAAGGMPEAVDRALLGDPVAAFGGIVACSHEIDEPTAERLSADGLFLEVIAAAGFTMAALERLRARWKNTRLLAVGEVAKPTPGRTLRTVPGGALVQQADVLRPGGDWTHAAGPPLTRDAERDARTLVCVARALTSNAVAIGGRTDGGVALFGAGAGQMDRLTSCRLAADKAGDRARGGMAASDGFFPFPDGPEILIDAGVTAIVQPGGSRRDGETIELCEDRGVTLVMTGMRHFRH
ncbi:MAG: bifunctional phosphoribosylaminoimidazolecarboxamide formyltransferase/IMP cyclohydrolase [Planctomycetota bacterium]